MKSSLFLKRCFSQTQAAVPKIMDPVFAKTSPKRSFCMTENERFGLVFGKTGSKNSGTGLHATELLAEKFG